MAFSSWVRAKFSAFYFYHLSPLFVASGNSLCILARVGFLSDFFLILWVFSPYVYVCINFCTWKLGEAAARTVGKADFWIGNSFWSCLLRKILSLHKCTTEYTFDICRDVYAALCVSGDLCPPLKCKCWQAQLMQFQSKPRHHNKLLHVIIFGSLPLKFTWFVSRESIL